MVRDAFYPNAPHHERICLFNLVSLRIDDFLYRVHIFFNIFYLTIFYCSARPELVEGYDLKKCALQLGINSEFIISNPKDKNIFRLTESF